LQEDESEIISRKMKQEEEYVDIEMGVDISEVAPVRTNGNVDDDAIWAEDEDDEDVVGWKMKLVMENDEDM
jgi:COMPASS component SWD1